MSKPQTIVGKIDRLLDDHCAVDEIAVLLGLDLAEVDRIARLLREVGPPDPDPLPAADIQATADQVAALDDPHDGWPRIGTSYAIDRGQALRQVQAATVVLRRATSDADLDDLAGALGIRHALGVAEQVMLPTAGPEHDPGCDCCSCELDLISIDATAEPTADDVWSAIGKARVMFWDCPDHLDAQCRPSPCVEWRGSVAHCLHAGCLRTSDNTTPADYADPTSEPDSVVVDPAADRRCTRSPGCPWVGDVECTDCDGSEAARRARYDATPEVDEQPAPSTGHVHDPFAVANEAGVWYAECECGTRWDRQPCDACGAPVSALHVARTGTARHDHHGGQ